jgi:hypothetical protein
MKNLGIKLCRKGDEKCAWRMRFEWSDMISDDTRSIVLGGFAFASSVEE